MVSISRFPERARKFQTARVFLSVSASGSGILGIPAQPYLFVRALKYASTTLLMNLQELMAFKVKTLTKTFTKSKSPQKNMTQM